MTLELIRRLNDAGFPKKLVNTELMHGGYPTLYELIEACGDKFGGVDLVLPREGIRLPHFWSAKDRKGNIHNAWTSEEAVAKLWLALNKKSE